MGKSTPKAPTPPDPYAVAAAQTGSNIDTAVANANLNRIDQYTPQGSLTYQVVGTNADGTPKYQQTQTYSPEQQTLYDNQNKVSNALSNLSLANVGRVADAQSKPFTYNGMTPLQTSIQQPNVSQTYDPGGQIQTGYQTGQAKTGYDAGGPIQGQIGSSPDLQYGYQSGGNIQDSYASGGNIQRQYDFNGLNAIPGTSDYGAEAKRTQDAVYGQATSRLDPQFEQQQRALGASLINKGVSENSEAYRRAMDQFARQKTDAYNQANFSSIGAGSQEQSRLFGLALQGRQQGVSEAEAQGQFGNSAQAQAEAQNAARAGFGNQAQAQRDQQNAAMAAFYNQAQGQQFGQQQARGSFANTAQQQQYDQNQGAAAFYNQGTQQNNQTNADLAQFGNQAQYQQNNQNQSAAAFGNQAAGQIFGMNQTNANFNNTARQQQIQEAAYLRELPLNEVNALTAGSAVQAPQFQDYNAASVANTDYSGIMQQGFQNQNAIYQQQMASRNAALGAIFGTIGGIGSAAVMSDRRVKENIKAIGELANGLKTYVFNYIGKKATEFGVMADEVFKVIPDAVIVRPDGYMMVDYRKVW